MKEIRPASILVGTIMLAYLSAVGTASAQVCGNSVVEGDEQCDDGDSVGGDGCAGNCTNEVEFDCQFAAGSTQVANAQFFAIPSSLMGAMTIRAGRARSGDPSGEIPVVVRQDQFISAPTAGTLGTSCLLGAPLVEAGSGNAGIGTIGCGAGGLTDLSYVDQADHNNGMSTLSFTGGGTTGAMKLKLRFASYFITGLSQTCFVGPGDPSRPEGADGIACTADDPAAQLSPPVEFLLTSGTAVGRVLNLNGSAQTFERSITGLAPDCGHLSGDPTTALNGIKLAAADSQLNLAQIGDAVVTMQIQCEPITHATPTPTCSLPPTRTPTPTFTAATSPTPEATLSPTFTATAVPTSTSVVPDSPTPSNTPVPSATPLATATETVSPTSCSGDCDGSGEVTVDEILRGVSIALGLAQVDTCPAFDTVVDGMVTVDEIILAVNAALMGCP